MPGSRIGADAVRDDEGGMQGAGGILTERCFDAWVPDRRGRRPG